MLTINCSNTISHIETVTEEESVLCLLERLNEKVEIKVTNSREGDILPLLEELYTLYNDENKDDPRKKNRVELERMEIRLSLEKKKLHSDYESAIALKKEVGSYHRQAKQFLDSNSLHLIQLSHLEKLMELYINSIYTNIERVEVAISNILVYTMENFY